MALSLRQSVRQQPMQIADRLHIPLWMDHGVREALQDEKGPLFIASTRATRLDDIATRTIAALPTTRPGLAWEWQMLWIHVYPRRQTSMGATLAGRRRKSPRR